MKYKIGDKVKIKTWKEIEEEYGCENRDSENIYCKCACVFLKKMETNIEELNCNRILTIKNNYNNNLCFLLLHILSSFLSMSLFLLYPLFCISSYIQYLKSN